MNVFNYTKLVKPGKIWITTLEQCFKYKIQYEIDVYDWEKLEGGGSMVCRDSFTLETLLSECAEVQEFARRFFPEYTI